MRQCNNQMLFKCSVEDKIFLFSTLYLRKGNKMFSDYKKNINFLKYVILSIFSFVLILSIFFVCRSLTASASETVEERHYFTMYTDSYMYECFVEGGKVVAYYDDGFIYDYSAHSYEVQDAYNAPSFNFYRLNSAGTGVEKVMARYSKRYILSDDEWVLDHDYATDSGFPTVLSIYADGHAIYGSQTFDFAGSDIDLLQVDIAQRMVVPQKGRTKKYVNQAHDINTNLFSYLINGTFSDLGAHYTFVLHESMDTIVPMAVNSSGQLRSTMDTTLSVAYDEENGVVSWNDFVVDESKVQKKGVIALFYTNAAGGHWAAYREPLTGSSYSVSLGGTDLGNWTNGRYTQMMFVPYYLGTDHKFYIGKGSPIDIEEDSKVATRTASKMLTMVKKSSKSNEVFPSKGSSNYPDFSESQVNNAFYLKNFSAVFSNISKTKYLNVSWEGIFHTVSSLESEVNNYQNSFVVIQLAYALKNNVSDIIQTVDYEKIYRFSDNGFYIPWDSLQSENSSAYLKYVKVTPFYNNLDMPAARLYEGKSSFIYFDIYGDLSRSLLGEDKDVEASGSIREGTRYLSDFYLSGVSVDDTIMGNSVICWKGTTSTASDFVPDSETLVIGTYCVYTDSSGNISVREYKTATIGDRKMYVSTSDIMSDCEMEGVLWDGEIRLTPCYRSNGILYIGEQTVVNILDGSISDVGDSGSGSVIVKPNESVSGDSVSSGDSGFSSSLSDGAAGFSFSNIGKITDFLNYAISFLFSVVAAMGSFPNLLASVFSFLPSFFIDFLVVSFIVLVFLRVVGR